MNDEIMGRFGEIEAWILAALGATPNFKGRTYFAEYAAVLGARLPQCELIVELGVAEGASLLAWSRLCPRATCIGVDVARNLRLTEALSGLKLQAWPFKGRIGVREASGELTELHVLDHWCYLGTVHAEHELHALDAKPVFDPDTYKILKRFLGGRRDDVAIIPLAA